MLMYNWFEFYDWVLGPEGPSPKPSQDIINDDLALDDFIDTWKKSFKKKPKKGSGSFKLD